MVAEGLLAPVDGLMNRAVAEEVNATRLYKGVSFPFSFILAPSGRRNRDILSTAVKGEVLDLMEGKHKRGELIVEELFEIDPKKRVEMIFGTSDPSHPGVASTLARLGSLAVSGAYTIDFPAIKETKRLISQRAAELEAKCITGLVMSAKPLNRAHERLIRLLLDKSDLVVLFLQKPYTYEESLSYNIRLEALQHLVENYFPINRILIVPLEKTYIFAELNELIIDSLLLQNLGCTKFVIGREHTGLGMYYEHQQSKSIFDTIHGLSIQIEISSNFVYCDRCKTLVSTQTCPHGQHHHISYHSSSILELLKVGLLPPPMLVRKEIAAIYLSHLFPNRFKRLEKIYADMIPCTGLIESHSERDFYQELAKLYQTTSLT